MSTTTNFYNNTPVYASTSALSAVDTSVVTDGVAFQNGALAIVTGTGMYQWLKDGLETVNGTTVLAATGGGQWVSYTSEGGAYLIMSDNNVIDASQVQLSGADIALTNNYILVGNSSNVAAGVAQTGDVSVSNTGVFAITAGAVVNADINASAAIAYSKLATLTSGNILVGSAGNVPTAVAMSGDATIVASGALTIGAGAVTLAKLSAGVAPAYIVKYAGTQANGGGSATVAITVTGVASTDVVFAQLSASTNAVSVQKVTATLNTITVIFSGDPGAATVISYQALRAAA